TLRCAWECFADCAHLDVSPQRTRFASVQKGPDSRTRWLSVTLMTALVVPASACGDPAPRGNDRWVVTENSAVEIDWDAIAKAYREAEGPEDLERRINEIYAGDEVISIAVRDVDEKTQQVSGFFDRNSNGREDAD